MNIIDQIQRARDDFDNATNGRCPLKLRFGKKQMRDFEKWADHYTWAKDPSTGKASSWGEVPIEVTEDEDLMEFV